MSVGIQRLDGVDVHRAPLQAVRRREQHGRQRDREQEDRERPHEVHHARQDDVDRAAEEARDEAEQQRDEAADERGADADLERRPPAVQDAREHVAALAVGPDQVVRLPGRADRVLADPERAAALLDDLDPLAVDDGRAVDVGGERVDVRDVVRPDRGPEADQDDRHEQRQRGHRDAVAREPPPGEEPGILPRHLPGGLAGGERDARRLRLEGELRHAVAASLATSPTPGRAACTTAG